MVILGVPHCSYAKPHKVRGEEMKQAGAELGQAQDKLKVIVDVGVKVQVIV